ncbi:hypothetical protein D0862_00334 [Hortaea werneckii]|uniref:Ribose-5-phosphate isomerase n=1 Tax=Hortaea werneckii TaxID=91943 RepID=A0A3M7HYQ1_HORWE|nr:hypothetical protein D0862_00334 [Hortaea werneckii]
MAGMAGLGRRASANEARTLTAPNAVTVTVTGHPVNLGSAVITHKHIQNNHPGGTKLLSTLPAATTRPRPRPRSLLAPWTSSHVYNTSTSTFTSPPHQTRTFHPTPTRLALSSSRTATTATHSTMSAELSPVESAKRKAAYRAVAEHFRSDMRFVGIGSGSTIVYGVEAIKDHLQKNPPPANHMNWFVPTGWNSRKVIESAGLNPIAFDSLPGDSVMDVCFDGADEVDEELNCIKGGGACLFQEKLVACRSKKFVCIADYRKNQKRLLTQWPSIPIEVAPIAHASVLKELKAIGSTDPKLREQTVAKAGPIQTDQSFYIIDAPFPKLLTTLDAKNGMDGSGKNGQWDITTLAERIKQMSGVLEVGLFHGMNGYEAQAAGLPGGQKPVAVYFGMEDGEVLKRDVKDVAELIK